MKKFSLLILLTTLMMLLTASTAAGQAVRVNPGDTVTVDTPHVLIPGDQFIQVENQLDSLTFWKAKYGALTSLTNDYLAKANFWESEYNELRELVKNKPSESFWDKLQNSSAFVTLGYAACRATE